MSLGLEGSRIFTPTACALVVMAECLLPASPRLVRLNLVLGIPPEGVFQESSVETAGLPTA